jgi:hypothetical protein
MQTVYTIYQTNAAVRATKFLHQTLLASHPPDERRNVKIITTIVTAYGGPLLAPNDPSHYRYIRVVIDVPKSRFQSAEAKQALLQRTVDACLDYEGKHGEDCEVEVKINEVDENDYVRFRGRKPVVA